MAGVLATHSAVWGASVGEPVSRHYLDHASTSPLRPEAAAAIAHWMTAAAGDPGRIHEEGGAVRVAVETAREQVAGLLGARPREVIFTSGATEACNAAAWGAARAVPGGAMLLAPVEHSAVRRASERLAPVVELPVDGVGRLAADAVDAVLDDALRSAAAGATPRPALVHCQWANHEVGTLQPVEAVVARCREAGVLVHVDAATAAGHVVVDLAALGADLVSVSSHKLGGPPGVGALVVRRGVRLEPLVVGGAQERGRRAGMENVLGVVGFGAAAEAAAGALGDEGVAARHHTERLAAAATGVEGVTLLGDQTARVPHVLCLQIDGVEAEPVLVGLDRSGIAAHSGSACSSEALEPSPVLAAMGADPGRSLRLSVGWSTTDEDVDAFARVFPRAVAALRALAASG